VWGWLPGCLFVWAVWVWAGRGACSRGRLGDCAVVHCCAGWLVAWCVWCRKHARCGGLLRPCGRGGLLVVGAPACLGACGGGMLSGFWGSAPWLPDPSGLLICCWGLWVGVGGLVVNCIVDASILL